MSFLEAERGAHCPLPVDALSASQVLAGPPQPHEGLSMIIQQFPPGRVL